jgi:hypothetical protein
VEVNACFTLGGHSMMGQEFIDVCAHDNGFGTYGGSSRFIFPTGSHAAILDISYNGRSIATIAGGVSDGISLSP